MQILKHTNWFNPSFPSILMAVAARDPSAPGSISLSNATICNFLLLWSPSGTFCYFLHHFPPLVAFVSRFLCVFVSCCLPFIFSISHISLYPVPFPPPTLWLPSPCGSGLPTVDYRTSDCSPSLHDPTSCVRLKFSQNKSAQFRWICVFFFFF